MLVSSAIALAAWSTAASAEPSPQGTINGGGQRYSATLRDPPDTRLQRAIGVTYWRCDRGGHCIAFGEFVAPSVAACRAFREHFGPVTAYAHGRAALSASALRACNGAAHGTRRAASSEETPRPARTPTPEPRTTPSRTGSGRVERESLDRLAESAALLEILRRSRAEDPPEDRSGTRRTTKQPDPRTTSRAQRIPDRGRYARNIRAQRPWSSLDYEERSRYHGSERLQRMGYTQVRSQGRDCDDGQAAVHVHAAEVCDHVDNNCDGRIDEGQTLAFYRDRDGDGHGDPRQRVDACPVDQGHGSAEDGWLVLVGNDCDDTNAGRWQECRP